MKVSKKIIIPAIALSFTVNFAGIGAKAFSELSEGDSNLSNNIEEIKLVDENKEPDIADEEGQNNPVSLLSDDSNDKKEEQILAETDDGIVHITKTATKVDGKSNKWKIDTKIKAEKKEQKYDVVIVIDKSRKMSENGRLDNAKKNAKILAKSILDSNKEGLEKNRVALVTFHSLAKKELDFTTDLNSIEKKIDEIRGASYFTDGAFTQAAIREAGKMLNENKVNSNEVGKHMVLFTYGKSSYSYNVKDAKKLRREYVRKIDTTLRILGYPINIIRNSIGVPFFDIVRLNRINTENVSESDFDYTHRIGNGDDQYYYTNRYSKENKLISGSLKSILDSYFYDFFNKNESIARELTKQRNYEFFDMGYSANAEANIARSKGIKIHAVKSDNKKNEFDMYLEKFTKKNRLYESLDENASKKFDINLENLMLKDYIKDSKFKLVDSNNVTADFGVAKYNTGSFLSTSSVTWDLKDYPYDGKEYTMTYYLETKSENESVDDESTNSTLTYLYDFEKKSLKVNPVRLKYNVKKEENNKIEDNSGDKDKIKPSVDDKKDNSDNKENIQPPVDDKRDNHSSKSNSSKIERIYGSDRFETAVKVSQKNYTTSKYAIISNAYKYTDVLTASPIASKLGAPILFTKVDEINKSTLEEINRLGVEKIIISGGESSVSKEIEKKLQEMGYKVERIGGIDRYETASLFADKLGSITNIDNVVFASGEDFPDALSISSLATKNSMPILLTSKDNTSKYIVERLEKIKPQRLYFAGGESSISRTTRESLSKYSLLNEYELFAGKDRYETAKIIADKVKNTSNRVVIASGEVFADALCSSGFAYLNNSPILLSRYNDLTQVNADYIKTAQFGIATIIGGENTISKSIETNLKNIMK